MRDLLRRIVRGFRCHLLDRHENAYNASLGWRPLFPIRCDHCGDMYYVSHPGAPDE